MWIGSDFANQLADMLKRFRKEENAFTGNIDKMYFQVQVAKKHRNDLRFTWWEDNDLSGDTIDRQMCVHVLGEVLA